MSNCLRLGASSSGASFSRIAMGCLSAAMIFSVAGCSSLPSQQDIDKRYNEEGKDLKDFYEELLEECNRLFPASSPPTNAECKAAAFEWYNQAKQKLLASKSAANNRRWDEMYLDKKEWDEFLRKQLEDVNLPGVIKDIIKKKVGVTASITTNWLGELAACNGSGECYQNLIIQGPTSITSSAGVDSGTFKINLDAKGIFDTIAADARPFSGTFTMQSDVAGEVTGNLVDHPSNRLYFDASGQGTLVALFDISYSVSGWNAVLPRHTFMGINLTRAANGMVYCNATNAPTSAVFLSTPSAVTDFNRDGVRDFATDHAAFLAALAAQNPRADVNDDKLWDTLDDSEWQQMFAEDTN